VENNKNVISFDMVHEIKNLTQMRICMLFWANMKGKMWKYGMEIFPPHVTKSGNAWN